MVRLLNYKLPSGLPAGSRAAWSRALVQPLGADLLTPFSFSVLAEVLGRAWYLHYDRLGFDPMPRARVVRQHNGRAYFNLTMSAQREAEHAALEPVTFKIDGTPFPVVKVEKGGFLAAIKAGQNLRKLTRTARTLAEESAALDQTVRQWYARVLEMRWTQAEILFIMEEIEPRATETLLPFLAARNGILLHVNRLMRLANQPPTETLRQIDRGLGNDGVLEAEIARRLNRMAARVSPAQREWIENGDPADWKTRLGDATLVSEVEKFLADYGHRAANLGEIAEPRWNDDLRPLLRALLTPPPAPAANDAHAVSVLLAAVDARERKAAQESVDELRVLVPLQSRALDAFAWVLAGTRRWVWGAGREAMSDKRLTDLDVIFFYELEEIKQMMTGEWNISDRHRIVSTADKRKADYELWRVATAPDLMIGESAAETLDRLEPSCVLEPSVHLAAAMRQRTATVAEATS